MLAFVLTLLEVGAAVVSVVGLVVLIIWGFVLHIKSSFNRRSIILMLFLAGLVLRLQYILYTGCMERQHDVEVFGCGFGHSGYIEYLYNNLRLPDFDVREVWQFYHPPLHHIISAVFLKLCNWFGIEYSLSLEALQVLTFFYSSLCMYISYRILRELKIDGVPLLITFAIIAFHPTFIIFAGSINNDILSITFQLSAVLYTLRWIKEKTVPNIIGIALCIGLGMMTKLSAWMVAPGVALVFLCEFIKGLKNKRYNLRFFVRQYSVFGIICVPLGLWWSVRNYLLHSVSPNYIPFLDYDNPQYIGNIPVLKRLFDFGAHQFESVFDMWGKPYYEYNPTIGLLKTAMFGESINDTAYPSITLFATVLFWLGTILATVGFIAMCYYLISRRFRKSLSDLLLVSEYFVNLIMYYYFCISFAFTCTQNIRYAAPLILIGAVYIGRVFCTEENNGKAVNILTNSTIVLTMLFGIFSLATYTLIGL